MLCLRYEKNFSIKKKLNLTYEQNIYNILLSEIYNKICFIISYDGKILIFLVMK